MQFSKDKNGDLKFLGAKTCPRGKTLIKVCGIKSRFKSSTNRTVRILFSKNKILDTFCSCPAGTRNTGCAHAIAVLRYIIEQKTGNPTLPKSRSQALVDFIKVPVEYVSDCEGGESDVDTDGEGD